MPTSGLIIDHFDDPEFMLLSGVLQGQDPPPIIKTAHAIEPDSLDELPDQAFALVMVDDGQKMRKFACVDPGHTALSTLYFHETYGKLPAEAIKVAAANLMAANEHFGLPISDTLRSLATEEQEKTAGVFVDISGKHPMTAQEATVEEGDYLLNGRFPVQNYGHVKQAESHFLDSGNRMTPRDRHEYCTGLVKKAGAYGIELHPTIRKYGGPGYGADVEAFLGARREFLPEDAHPVLEKLATAIPVTPPGDFAEALAEFDKATGLNHYYDQHVPDPWWTTFGPAFDKVAEFVWNQGSEHVTGSDLDDLAVNNTTLVKDQFGDDVADAFLADPVTTFNSLPDPHKIILARMASDTHTGGASAAGS